MRMVYMGSGELGLNCLDAVLESEHELCLIVTQPARRGGRGRKPQPTAVAQWAQRNGVACIEADDVNCEAIVDAIAAEKPDLILVIAFGQFIGKSIREMPPKGCINVHASLLPKYRGAAPINRAIVNGEKETGVSIITVMKKMDAGDIISLAKTPIYSEDTAGSLHARLAELAAPLLIETLGDIENGSANYVRQDESQVTFAPKMKKSDGYIDFSESAEAVKRKIHGFWPWPGAAADYVSQDGQRCVRVTFANAKCWDYANCELQPGMLDENLHIVCGRGALEIIEIKPQGSGLMSYADFVNGRHLRPGDMFIKIEH